MGGLMKMLDLSFYKGKRVFVTGHTGFKGSWLCRILINAGAEVTGYSLDLPTEPSLFELADIGSGMKSVMGDIADLDTLGKAFEAAKPEIVLHLAAQPLVRRGYAEPVYTYRTNVMGTVNILECIRRSDSVKSVVNVTTDKVYKNNEWWYGYRESDALGGYDPYSNSKSCSELVTQSYIDSYLSGRDMAVSAMRAGNVIGGGDFAADRIIPDCVRAAMKGEAVTIRSPHSVRPFQYVLEPVCAYLMLAEMQYSDRSLAGCYNIGPDDTDCATIDRLTDIFVKEWGEGASKTVIGNNGPHEAKYLKLDCSKIRSVLGWKPVWSIEQAIAATVEWSKVYAEGGDVKAVMDKQINEFLELMNNG